MIKSISFLITLSFLFLGCSTKINLKDYRPKVVPKAAYIPSNLKQKNVNKGLVEPFKNDLNLYLTNKFLSSLLATNLLNSIKLIKAENEKDYIKLAQIEKDSEESVNYFLIKGVLSSLNIVDSGTYHPPLYNKKGKLISSSYYSYGVCAIGSVNVFKLPSENIVASYSSRKCSYDSSKYPNYNLIRELKFNALSRVGSSLVKHIRYVFTPTGYIYEIRENKDHELIAHITLGFEDGLKQNMKVFIYELRKDKFNNESLIKVGEGRVSNQLFTNNAWITLEMKDGYIPKIGYIVKPDLSVGFWEDL